MKTSILTGRIGAPMIFFGNEPAGGGGGGGAGGAAVAAPPAGGEGGGDGDSAIMDFTAPNIDDVAAHLSKKGSDTPEPKPGDKKPAAKPAPAVKKEEPKPGEGGEPVAKLREGYEALKKEHEELKAKHGAGDPRVKVLEAERDAARAEHAAEKKRVEEFEHRRLMSDEAIAEQMKPFDQPYDEKATRFYRTVEISHPIVKALTVEYSKLPPGTDPNYHKQRAELAKVVNRTLLKDKWNAEDVDSNPQHPDLAKTMDWLEETYQFAIARDRKWKEVSGNARKIVEEGELKGFRGRKTDFDKRLDDALKVPDGLDKTDPAHPKVMMAAFDKILKPEEVTALDKGIREFVELAVLGTSPRTAADYVGMTPEAVAQSKAAEAQRVELAKAYVPDALFNGIRALRRVPTLMKLLAKYQARLGEKIDGEPPDPNNPGGGGGDDDEAGDDLANFKAPDLSKLKI